MATLTARALAGEARALNCLTCRRQRPQARAQWAFHKEDVQLAKRRKHSGAAERPAFSFNQHDATTSLHELAAQSREQSREQETDHATSGVDSNSAQEGGIARHQPGLVRRHFYGNEEDDEPGRWKVRRLMASPSIDKWHYDDPEWRPRHSRTDYRAKYDYESGLETALHHRDAPGTTRCLEMVISDQNTSIMKSMSDEAFNMVLKLVHPLKAYGNIMPLQLRMRPELYKTLQLAGIGHLIDTTTRRLRAVLGLWRHAGKTLTGIHYSSLLEITRYIRDGRPARKLWTEADKSELSVEDFNNYLASILYDRPLEFKSDFSERALPHRIKRRTWDVLPVGHRDFRTGDKGVLNAVMAELSRMGEHGLVLDANTYAICIRAASLEGNLSQVNELLQTIWGIDAVAIIAGDDGYPKLMAGDDPLYPTQELLGEVVRAYCNNNDMLGANKMLEFMSRFYDIKVRSETWLKLLEYAHLLATPRQHEEDVRNIGTVPNSVTTTIWQKMLSPPHSAVASIYHADLAIRSANREKHTYDLLSIMSYFRRHFTEVTAVQRQAAWDALCSARAALEDEGELVEFQDHMKHPRLAQLAQRYTECDLECQDALTKFRSWLFYIMHDTERHDETMHQEHYTVEIPRMLHEWAPFSERVFYYFIPTGIVELDLGEQWHEDHPLQQEPEQKVFRGMLKYRTLDPDPFKTSMPEDESTSSAIHYLAEKKYPPVAQVATIGHGGKRERLLSTPENRWPIFNSNYTPPVPEGSEDSTTKLTGNRSWPAMAGNEAWEGNSPEGRQTYWRHVSRRQKKARTPREPLHDPWAYAKPLSFKQRAKRERARMHIEPS